jgi:hypothetical protein
MKKKASEKYNSRIKHQTKTALVNSESSKSTKLPTRQLITCVERKYGFVATEVSLEELRQVKERYAKKYCVDNDDERKKGENV